jgi:hypothetical protein
MEVCVHSQCLTTVHPGTCILLLCVAADHDVEAAVLRSQHALQHAAAVIAAAVSVLTVLVIFVMNPDSCAYALQGS